MTPPLAHLAALARRARLNENWPAKAVCAALAIVLYVYHHNDQLQERHLSLPLGVETSTALTPASDYPRSVRVTIRGEPTSVEPIREDDLEAYVDFNGAAKPGDYRGTVKIRTKGTAQGVAPLDMSWEPLEIAVTLDTRVSRYVPVRAEPRGAAQPGYVLDSLTLNPSQVIIEGPARLAQDVTELTAEVDLDGRAGNFTVMVPLDTRNPLVTIRGSGMTEARGVVSRVIPVRNITGIPIRITGLAPDLRGELDARTGRARLEGERQEDLDAFTPPEFLNVDCRGIVGPGAYTLPVDPPRAPDRVSLQVEPREVTVLVAAAASAASEAE